MMPEPLFTLEVYDEEEAEALFVALGSVPSVHDGHEWAHDQAVELLDSLPEGAVGDVLMRALDFAFEQALDSARQEGREEARMMGR